MPKPRRFPAPWSIEEMRVKRQFEIMRQSLLLVTLRAHGDRSKKQTNSRAKRYGLSEIEKASPWFTGKPRSSPGRKLATTKLL